jgi:hypothetical protein
MVKIKKMIKNIQLIARIFSDIPWFEIKIGCYALNEKVQNAAPVYPLVSVCSAPFSGYRSGWLNTSALPGTSGSLPFVYQYRPGGQQQLSSAFQPFGQ